MCREQVSYTRDFIEEGWEKNALLDAPKLPLLNNLPNFDCTGLKLIHLREYLTERDIKYDGGSF